jgi:hydroxypyruvate reductase
MAHLSALRNAALEIFEAALRAVDARAATRQALSLEGPILGILEKDLSFSSPIYVVSIGKAALQMALGLNDALGKKIGNGIITAPPQLTEHSFASQWQIFNGGHPLPNEASLAAAQAVFNLIDRANAEAALVIFLVSGGGSAMIEWPVNEEITLVDLRKANRVLVECGASISEINAVRRAFSAVKGGAMARRALQARTVTFIISDTNPGDEANVASGPTLSPSRNSPDPLDVITRYRLENSLPPAILRTIHAGQDATRQLPTQESHPYHVLLDNRTAIKAAVQKARTLGFFTELAQDISEQPIAEGCVLLLSRVASLWENSETNTNGVCLISGGEFSCPVRGEGRGGRNLETVLRCAIEMDQEKQGLSLSHHTVVLSAGTDGIDGNSPVAGAIADDTTIARARSFGLEARTFLDRSDSYSFLAELEDAIKTGPTGTNVRDIRVVLRSGSDTRIQVVS